jgi:hypothetical protein
MPVTFTGPVTGPELATPVAVSAMLVSMLIGLMIHRVDSCSLSKRNSNHTFATVKV